MSFIGTAGVVAQQGNQAASAPTAVSIATGSSGNYDESFVVDDNSGCSFTVMSVGATQWTSNALTLNPSVSAFSAFDGCSAQSYNRALAYLRATGATSYSWVLLLTSSSLSNGCTAAIAGTTVTTQDCTTGGVGEYLSITFGGGRGGQTYPANGDSIVMTLKATATNSTGSTGATNCVLTYNFIS
jgi:hypothetical protein